MRTVQVAADRLNRSLGRGQIGHAGEDQEDLVTAEASDEVVLVQRAAHLGSDGLQHVVAHRVTVGVVDLLETIEVAEGDSDLESLARMLAEQSSKPVEDFGPVEQSGEFVIARAVVEHLLGLHLGVDGAERRHDAVDFAVAALEGGGVDLHPVKLALGIAQPKPGDAPLTGVDLTATLLRQGDVIRVGEFLELMANPLLGLPPEHPGQGGGQPDHHPVAGVQHCVGGVLRQEAKLLLRLGHELRCPVPVGDVPEGQRDLAVDRHGPDVEPGAVMCDFRDHRLVVQDHRRSGGQGVGAPP